MNEQHSGELVDGPAAEVVIAFKGIAPDELDIPAHVFTEGGHPESEVARYVRERGDALDGHSRYVYVCSSFNEEHPPARS